MFMTYEKLVAAGACKKQALLFKQLFPKGVQITAALCREYAGMFDFDWASRLLPNAQRREYKRAEASAWAEFNRTKASAWAEYDRTKASARAEYDRTKASARAEYERVTAPAWAEYERVRALARAEYNRTKASAFGTQAETVE